MKRRLGSFRNFLKIRRDIRKSRCTTGMNDTGGKFCHQYRWCCWYQGQICRRWQRRRRQLANVINDTGCTFATGDKQWEQYQTAETLKWTWRKKFIYELTLLPKGVKKKYLKLFWWKIFPFATGVLHLELVISPRIFERIRNGCNGILRGLGEADSWKNLKSKISWHCPFHSGKMGWKNLTVLFL